MHFIDHAHDEPRWAGLVRLGAAGVFAAVVAVTAVVEVMFIADNEPPMATAVVATGGHAVATVQR